MKTNQVVKSALGIALVFLATFILKIPNGIQGYLNLGDAFILLFAHFLSPSLAFLVSGVGSSLADLIGGYGIYVFATLLIKGIEGALLSYLLNRYPQMRYLFYFVACCWMVLTYAFMDAFVNQSWGIVVLSILGNSIQAIIAISIACVGLPLLKKIMH